MKRWMLLVSLVGVMGCAAGVWYGNLSHRTSRTLAIGMSQQQAKSLLGSPQAVSAQRLQGVIVETWRYLDKTLTFHNGLLASWVTVPAPRAPNASPGS